MSNIFQLLEYLGDVTHHVNKTQKQILTWYFPLNLMTTLK